MKADKSKIKVYAVFLFITGAVGGLSALLTNMGITDEDIKFSINFDFIINSQNKKFKTNISLDLPPSEITTSGKSSLEITNTSKFIFKRVND